MKELKYEKYDQEITHFELDNGFKVIFIPNLNKKEYYITIGYHYGSNNNAFYNKAGKLIKLPLGTAHFLEHKMYEMPNNESVFDYLGNSGTDTNAGTSHYYTKYMIWGTNNVIENTKYLIDVVFTPHFTEKNVDSEKPIIKEEMEMYGDDPLNIIEEYERKKIFVKHPIRDIIIGTYKEICKITPDILYEIYNRYYNPSNMFMIIGGNYDYKEMYNLIMNDKRITDYKKEEFKEIKKVIEPEYIAKYKDTFYVNVTEPKIHYNFKINLDKIEGNDIIKKVMYMKCLINNLFGDTSLFKEKLDKRDDISNFYYSFSTVDNYLIINFEADTKNSQILKKMIDDTLKELPLDRESFNSFIKNIISLEINSLDNIYSTCDDMFVDILIYNRVDIDRIKLIKTFTFEELERISKQISFKNNMFINILPKKE